MKKFFKWLFKEDKENIDLTWADINSIKQNANLKDLANLFQLVQEQKKQYDQLFNQKEEFKKQLYVVSEKVNSLKNEIDYLLQVEYSKSFPGSNVNPTEKFLTHLDGSDECFDQDPPAYYQD